MPANYSALIFDCDGTLTDSMPVHFVAWQQTMSRYGIAFSESRFYEMAGVPTSKIIEILGRENEIELDVPKVSIERDDAFEMLAGTVAAVEPVVDIARLWRGKIPMAIASGSVRKSVEKQLASLEIIDWFAAIVTAEDTVRHKPDPDVFLEAAKRLEVSPAECCVYEDGDLGIQAARTANMDVVDVRPLIKKWKKCRK